MDALLRIDNLSRHFTVRRSMFNPSPLVVRAVDGVSLSIQRGETLGLVGESGCGKSTLARMVVGLLPPSSGGIFLHGQSTLGPHTGSLARKLQMIFQDPFASLNPRMRIGNSIAEPLIAMKDTNDTRLNKEERMARVHQSLNMVGLRPEHALRYPHEFSGGQRQRIAIARALIAEPELVVCDEAVSSLDASVQAQVLNLLSDLQENLGLSYLFISHDLGVVGYMSDRVAVMYLGRIVESGPRDALFRSPAHPYTRLLLSSIPKRAPSERCLLQTETTKSLDMPSPLAMPKACPFHPRCPQAMPICQKESPAWYSLEDKQAQSDVLQNSASQSHTVRCHLYGLRQ